MKHPRYPHVFEPITYGPLRLKNRIIGLPMMSGLSTPDGRVTKELVAHMGARAKTGVGLVYVGDSDLDHKHGLTHYMPLDLSYEGNTGGFTDLADEVHRYGAKIGIEVNHGGDYAYDAINSSGRRLAVSVNPDIPPRYPQHRDPIIIDRAIMDELVASYVGAADRLMRAGFDALMLHCGHGWLLSQFLSKRANRRTDEYGGSLENRMRFPLEVLKAVHEKVGGRMAVDVRVSTGGDLSPWGDDDIEEVITFLHAASPYVTGANISVGDQFLFDTTEYMIQSHYLPHMVNTKWAERVKAAGPDVVVSCSGSVVTVAEAEEILAGGRADMVGMGRATLVDYLHITKAFRGWENEIRPCLRCAHCTDRLFYFKPIRCAVNPLVGREYQYHDIPLARVKKKVMVVGGGPAGMEATQWLFKRGHDVVLYEKDDRLGGMLHVASALPDKYDLARYTEWQIRMTTECGARIVLGHEVGPDDIRREAPDAVLLAIGAELSHPPIPGIMGKNVVAAADVDTGTAPVGDRVVIMGAGQTGSECAIPLAREGKEVVLIDMYPRDKYEQSWMGNQAAMSILRLHRELGVTVILDSKIVQITDAGVKYLRTDGSEGFAEADTVINALGMEVPYDKIGELISVVPETYCIGDCFGDKMDIDTAVMTGFTYALEV